MVVVKRARGLIRVRLAPEERAVLAGFARDLAELLGGGRGEPEDPLAALVGMSSGAGPAAPPEDPALRRLLPDAYDDPEGAAEFRRLTDDELRRGKTAALTALADDVGAAGQAGAQAGGGAGGETAELTVELTAERADAWVQAINDLRLVLGVRLQIDDDDGGWRRSLSPNDPRLPVATAYDWLTGLQELLLDAMVRG